MNVISRRSAIKASLNFAADTTDGGIWSNDDRSLITQDLRSYDVELQDARQLPRSCSRIATATMARLWGACTARSSCRTAPAPARRAPAWSCGYSRFFECGAPPCRGMI